MPNIAEQIEEINQHFIELYLDNLHSKKPEIAGKLKAIIDFQSSQKTQENYVQFIKTKFLADQEISLGSLKNSESLRDALEEYAKINDILRRIRVIANQQFFNAEMNDKVADSIDYTITKLADAGDKIKSLVQNISVATATTSHPTNPTSVAYTKAAMEVAEVMSAFSDKTKTREDLSRAINNLIDSKISAEAKTQEQEVEEGLLYLNDLYKAAPLAHKELQEKLQSKFGADVKLPENPFNFAVWITGDGDGNPNSTEETLRYNIAKFREAIKENYRKDLESLDIPQEIKNNILTVLNNETKTVEDFKNVLQSNAGLDDLLQKCKIFGYHFAKIDIRHEANDIMKTVACLLKHVDAIDKNLTVENLTADKLKEYLENAEIIKKIADLDYKKVKFSDDKKEDELTKRIFGRFKAIAENPDMSEKIIIAEFKSAANIQAVMLLLKTTGNEVCNDKARLNIVPLAEEVDTLRQLPKDLQSALNDETYLQHVRNTKKIYFMIAKSDTVRRGGVGAQEAQETAVKESIKSIIKTLLEKGENLAGYEIVPYNGGGHALQRGGGRVSEMPSVYGRYALRALQDLQKEFEADQAKLEKIKQIKIDAPCFTVQGHQNYILFDPAELVGKASLSALASQSLYAAARLEEIIPDHEVEGMNPKSAETIELRNKAAAAQNKICEKAREVYEDIRDKDGPINKLFVNACWVSTKANNKSSRASVRGGADNTVEEVKTIAEIKGKPESLKLLEQRAIGAEKLCAHSGTNLVSWYGWDDALHELEKSNYPCSLNEMYKGNKSVRDYMRSAAISLYLTDFNHSWNMMIGEKRPTDAEIKSMSESYKAKFAAGQKSEISPKETLAYLEDKANETKKMIYKTITGKKYTSESNILEQWPQIQKEIDNRKEHCSFGVAVESMLTDLANKNPQELFDQNLRGLFEHAYCAVDTSVNTPIGVLASLTKDRSQQKDSSVLLSRSSSSSLGVEHAEIPLHKAFNAVKCKPADAVEGAVAASATKRGVQFAI